MDDLNKEDWGFVIKSWLDALSFSELTEEENEDFLSVRVKESVVRSLNFDD